MKNLTMLAILVALPALGDDKVMPGAACDPTRQGFDQLKDDEKKRCETDYEFSGRSFVFTDPWSDNDDKRDELERQGWTFTYVMGGREPRCKALPPGHSHDELYDGPFHFGKYVIHFEPRADGCHAEDALKVAPPKIWP